MKAAYGWIADDRWEIARCSYLLQNHGGYWGAGGDACDALEVQAVLLKVACNILASHAVHVHQLRSGERPEVS